MKYWLCFLLSLSCVAVVYGQNQANRHRQTFEKEKNARAAAAAKTPVILYHNGPIMAAPKDLYVVYYGSFTTTQHAILDNFLQNLGGSGAFNVNSEYSDASGATVTNILNYSPATDSFNDAYSLGTSLSGSFDTTIIHNYSQRHCQWTPANRRQRNLHSHHFAGCDSAKIGLVRLSQSFQRHCCWPGHQVCRRAGSADGVVA